MPLRVQVNGPRHCHHHHHRHHHLHLHLTPIPSLRVQMYEWNKAVGRAHAESVTGGAQPPVWAQFRAAGRRAYSATLHLTVRPTAPPDSMQVQYPFRPTAAHHVEVGQMGYEELRAKAAREHEKGQVGAGGALGELPVSLAEHGISTARNNAPCLLPNNLLHALPSGSNGATALALSRDGTRGRASDRAPHHTRAQPHSSPHTPPSLQAPSSRARSTPRTAPSWRSTTSAAASSGSASTPTTAPSTNCLGAPTLSHEPASCWPPPTLPPRSPLSLFPCRSADGQKLLSVSADGSAKLWRTTPMAGAEGEPLATLLHPSFVFCGKMQPPPQGGRRNSYAARARFYGPRLAHPLTRPAHSLVTPAACACPLPCPPPSPARSSDPHRPPSPPYRLSLIHI